MEVARTTILLVILSTTSIWMAPALGQEAGKEGAMIDHLVYVAPDLQSASDRIANELGVAPTPGGKHPGRGTINSLLSLGGRQYLEIIAPDPSLSELPGTAERIARLDAPEIFTFATENNELEVIEAKAKALGLKTSGIRPGSRRTPAGNLLEWRTLGVVVSKKYAGLMPFFIDWRETPHPGQTSAQGARLVRIVVTHPEPDGLRALYREFGVDVPVRSGKRPSIRVEIENGAKKVLLQGSGRGLQ